MKQGDHGPREPKRVQEVRLQRIRLARMKAEDPEVWRMRLDRQNELRRGKKQPPNTKAARTPEQWARILETQRARRDRESEAKAEARRARNRERTKERYHERRALVARTGPLPSGSVAATAAPGPWRDILADIGRRVPNHDERDEIVAEAALLAVQGLDVDTAVIQAKRKVSREAGPYRYMKPIEDCFWL